MIRFARAATVKPGKAAAAMAFASEVSGMVQNVTGGTVSVFVQVGGPVLRISWQMDVDSLGAYEEQMGQLMQNAEYMSKISEAADLFVEGETLDTIWKQI